MRAKQLLSGARPLLRSEPAAAREMLRQASLDEGAAEPCSEARVELAILHHLECDFTSALRYAEWALELQGATAWAKATAGVMANAARDGLETDVNLRQLADASTLSESIGEFYTAGLGWSIVASRRLAAGDYRMAIDEYGRAVQMYARAGASSAAARIAISLAQAFDGLNEPERGTQALEHAAARLRVATPSLGGTMLMRKLAKAIETRQGSVPHGPEPG